ncbi:ABC transporter substrate-binding protein [Gilvibacter sediminis]|uniref:ABC transporter substrate-binding protein n=1 Tax=Gilvibacter sediminis TaxID=379071 RepID=UPI00234FD6CD|nr:helical backbone metal receptor [Gilvibacter sediminis]MDC7999339.1 helical backbone metal receptor [Gilvibacter sediminis]
MQSKDQLGNTHHFKSVPQRIVSLVPSQTELLVDLGLTDNIVGLTKFCVHPEHLRKSKTVIGGTKKVNKEKIEALAPDIIIANKEENTQEIVESLGELAPVWVSDIYTVEDSLEFIAAMGALFNKNSIADQLIASINGEREQFRAHIKDQKRLKVAYLIWKNPFMAAGQATFIGDLMRENGFENMIEDPEGRYPEVSHELLTQADLVLLSSEPYPFKQEDAAQLSAQLHKPVKLVDGEYFSWYGSRLKDAYAYFKQMR